jgi:hypothetical protein
MPNKRKIVHCAVCGIKTPNIGRGLCQKHYAIDLRERKAKKLIQDEVAADIRHGQTEEWNYNDFIRS